MNNIIEDSIKESLSIGNIINNKTLLLIRLVSVFIIIGSTILLFLNILKNPSIINIILTSLVYLIIWLSCIIIYRVLIIKLLTDTTIKYNILLYLEKERLYIKDLILIKNLSMLDLRDIRDEKNVKRIEELVESISTTEGINLKDIVLKKGGFINYKIDNNEDTK